jgi:Spy/CpxP family protein refolding chaperone
MIYPCSSVLSVVLFFSVRHSQIIKNQSLHSDIRKSFVAISREFASPKKDQRLSADGWGVRFSGASVFKWKGATMKRLMQITLAAAIVAMAVSPVRAQQQRGRGFGGMGTLLILTQKSVQEELKLSDEQVKKVTELREKQQESFQGLRDLSPEERRTKMQEMTKTQNEAIAKLLKPEQLKRAKQISLQVQARTGLAFVLNNEEIAKELKITDEQKGKLDEIRTKMREEMQGLGFDEEGRQKRQEIMKTTSEKVEGVLTAEQKTKLKELQGEPFKGEIVPFGRRQRQN